MLMHVVKLLERVALPSKFDHSPISFDYTLTSEGHMYSASHNLRNAALGLLSISLYLDVCFVLLVM